MTTKTHLEHIKAPYSKDGMLFRFYKWLFNGKEKDKRRKDEEKHGKKGKYEEIEKEKYTISTL